jgi:pimeloyl-ACP methyl ester carboxylesterase
VDRVRNWFFCATILAPAFTTFKEHDPMTSQAGRFAARSHAAGLSVHREIELSAGPIEYDDTGGDGPVLVLLPGLFMDSSLWAHVVADLTPGHRCVTPTLPLGAHRRPMRADADLSPHGQARLVAELLERLELEDVTLVGNDTGGAIVQLVAANDALSRRVGRIVLVSCEAFDNVPPGLTGKTVVMTGKLPPALFGLFFQQMRLKPLRRMPIAFGWLTRRGDDAVARWIRPALTDRAIRRDAVRVLRELGTHRRMLVDLDDRLAAFDRPALVVWASEDRVMPPEHGRRLAGLLPQGRLVEIDDSYTLIPLDRADRLAEVIGRFARASQRPEVEATG